MREQLVQARAVITRQLEVLNSSVGMRGGHPDNRYLIAELERELAEIEEALRREDAADA